MNDDRLDRELLLDYAAEQMTEPKYDQPPTGAIAIPELVRTMRQTERAAVEARDDPETDVTPNFVFGFWTAMAAIRHDFAIEDARYVGVGDAE